MVPTVKYDLIEFMKWGLKTKPTAIHDLTWRTCFVLGGRGLWEGETKANASLRDCWTCSTQASAWSKLCMSPCLRVKKAESSSAIKSSTAHQAVISKPRSVSFLKPLIWIFAIPNAIQSRALRIIADEEINGNVNRVFLTGSCKDEGTASENKPEYVTLGTDKWSRHPGRE